MKDLCRLLLILALNSSVLLNAQQDTSKAFSKVRFQSQERRAQIPHWMQNSYFEVTPGAIFYDFSAQQLNPGFTLTAPVEIPHTAMRLVFTGVDFNKYLSARITYMRPVLWVRYAYRDNETNITGNRSVWTNVGGITLQGTWPVTQLFSVFGEGGLGIITRRGISDWITHKEIIPTANYATTFWGAGVQYALSNRWELQALINYSPAKEKLKQPATTFTGAGFVYHYAAFSEQRVQHSISKKHINPEQWLQIGYTSNAAGYNINKFFANKYFPVFWGGDARVSSGLSLNYQRNIFYSPGIFAVDWGINAGLWNTNYSVNGDDDRFFTLSVFPVFRLNWLHAKSFDSYFYYTISAPTYISATRVDNQQVGKHFTFMDNMGLGFFIGPQRKLNAELKIGHYSNGNLFPNNPGVMIPLSLQLGYVIK